MTTGATSLLGLALPVQGELSGTWGDTVNNSITSLIDSAIAGTTTLSTDADVTLTTTTLAANQARQSIIRWTTNNTTTTRYITAPAQSKNYVVMNQSPINQTIVFRGVGPTTGVTIPQNVTAVIAWNGSDFVVVSSYFRVPVVNITSGYDDLTINNRNRYLITTTYAGPIDLNYGTPPIGTTVTIYNKNTTSNTTAYNGGNSIIAPQTTGITFTTLTIAPYGVATLVKIDATTWLVISASRLVG